MVEIPIVVVFGPSEDAFYVGAGRRFYVQNMPPSFTNAVHGSTLPVGRIGWVSLDKTGKYWCAGSRVSQNIYYVLQPKAPLRSKIVSAGCDFASFPDFDLLSSETLADQIEDGRSPYYFINHQPPGHWSLNLPTYYINVIQLLRETFKESGRGDEFDLRLRWILFGKGRTHVYQFDNGFIHCLEGPHADPKHLLNQVLSAFETTGDPESPRWVLENSSSMCLYNDEYFFLKFRDPATDQVEFRYKLPTSMDDKLNELLELAETPEEQDALFIEQEKLKATIVANRKMDPSA